MDNQPVQYLVTTEAARLPPRDRGQIWMVDGTVPGWQADPRDRHWDHHRPGGAPIQIEEMPLPTGPRSLLDETAAPPRSPYLVTTLLDADACTAAAWVQLPRSRLDNPSVVRQLRALAWDCDHLRVPPDLADLADWALAAGEVLQTHKTVIAERLQLPRDRQDWTADDHVRSASVGFQEFTDWLIAAACDERPWPGDGTMGDHVRQTMEQIADQLIAQQRVWFITTDRGAIAICNGRSWGDDGWVNPRAFYRALDHLTPPAPLRAATISIRDRADGTLGYTLGSIPLHPDQAALDYTQGTFEALTAAERRKIPHADPWGGRKTVGGSPWNMPSHLTPEEVAAAIAQFTP
ncbi:MAG: hypothetical protein Fur0042_24530 [Cyanophyceae cyanobacterium]